MDRHLPRLREFDVVEPLRGGSLALLVVVWMTLFLVPKKTPGLGRLVADARPVNRLQSKPPPMNLPRIADVIRRILSWEVASKCDGVSFFYQFLLATGISEYFRARVGGRRGAVSEIRLKRMPMGWSFSPAIAQNVANMLTDGLGIAWVDDFIIGGSRATYDKTRESFIHRLSRYNVEVDDPRLIPSDRLTALGLEFDLRAKRYRICPSWVEKRSSRWGDILSRATEGKASFREIFELYGSLIWADYVCESPLWCRAEAMAALRQMAKDVGKNYDQHTQLPPYANLNVREWIADIVNNPWRQPDDDRKPASDRGFLFSDASSEGGAWIRIFNGIVVDGEAWTFDDDTVHIYLRELEAMCAGATFSSPHDIHAVDNAAAVGTVRRGFSSSYAANKLLRRTYGKRWPNIVWVPTTAQLADPYTRGTPLPPPPFPTSDWHKEVIAALDAQGFPDSKRKER